LAVKCWIRKECMMFSFDRTVRLMAASMALVSLAGVAWGACQYHASTCSSTSGSGFCGSSVTACENGIANAPSGYADSFVCTKQVKRVIRCVEYTGCAPGACSAPPPGNHTTGCRGGTPEQCCYCDTRGDSTDDEEAKEAWFCTEYESCPANP
jgi:hypothetical protein